MSDHPSLLLLLLFNPYIPPLSSPSVLEEKKESTSSFLTSLSLPPHFPPPSTQVLFLQRPVKRVVHLLLPLHPDLHPLPFLLYITTTLLVNDISSFFNDNCIIFSISMGFERITKAHLVQAVMAAWIVFSAWNTHMAVMAAPLPQSAAGGSSYPVNDSSLNDPFSTPDYLGNKF